MRSPSGWTWLGAAAGMLAGLGAAGAADLDGPMRGSIDIPPPPSATEYEVGLRYWYSTGETGWNHDASRVAPSLGNPTSKLTFRDVEAHSGEVFGRVQHHGTGLFAKGIAGLGAVVSGEFQDQDWLAGQVEFSDTTSTIDGDGLHYVMVDFGWSPLDIGTARLGGFVGYHYWHERLDAFGLRKNPDDLDPSTGLYPGYADVNVLSNEVEYHALRLGVDGRVELLPGLGLRGEAAYVPYALIDNEDSHHLRADPSAGDYYLGPVPNVRHEGDASGVEAEALLTYQASPWVEVGAGVRYWGLWGDGTVQNGTPPGRKLPVNDFDSERYGLLLQAGYRF